MLKKGSNITGRPGDVMKNLETPGKTGRVGRYVLVFLCLTANWPLASFKVKYSFEFCVLRCCDTDSCMKRLSMKLSLWEC